MTGEYSGRDLKRLAPELADSELARVIQYRQELLKFNRRLNLISRNTEAEIDETHLLDSILAVNLLSELPAGALIYDIGSGNGLPGVILSILRPDLSVRAVDSDSRKCEFIKHVGSTLKLANLSVSNQRAEELSGVEWAISRGFASILNACAACSDVVSAGGRFYHLKGVGWREESALMTAKLSDDWSSELVGEYSLSSSQVQRAVIRTLRKA